jgi:hypothetical protein
MVIFGTWGKWKVTISDKPNCITVGLEAAGSTRVFSYDYEGRPWTALIDQVSYRRGLDGKIVAKWQSEDRHRDRRWLTDDLARSVEAEARQLAESLLSAIQRGEFRPVEPISAHLRAGLECAAQFNLERAQSDIEQYHQVYYPVGILPPDQYMAVVLQLTEGCSFNTCTFCNFYRDRPFRIKQPDVFLEHAIAVRKFLGKGLSLRRTIFLGDANALVTPMVRLIPLLDQIHRVYDVEQMGGLFAFLDGFSGEKKSSADYALLRQHGLKRVYIGMESGNADLLRFLHKPGKPEDVVAAAQAMKAGGVPVGVIILLGAGGQQYSAVHVQDTIAALNAMHLDLDDIIYFSELIENEGLQYVSDAYQAQLHPLDEEERIAQGEAIEHGLTFTPEGGIPHISRYDIREFVY